MPRTAAEARAHDSQAFAIVENTPMTPRRRADVGFASTWASRVGRARAFRLRSRQARRAAVLVPDPDDDV